MFCFRQHNPTQGQYIPSGAGSSIRKIFSQKSSSYPNVQNNTVVGGHRHSIGTITYNNVWQTPTSENYSFTKPDTQTLNYTYNQNQHHVRFQDTESDEKHRKMKCADIESSLESLCLQMMEHALGP